MTSTGRSLPRPSRSAYGTQVQTISPASGSPSRSGWYAMRSPWAGGGSISMVAAEPERPSTRGPAGCGVRVNGVRSALRAPRRPRRAVMVPHTNRTRGRGAAQRATPLPSCVSAAAVGEDVALLAVHDGVDARDVVLVLHAEADRLLDDPADDVGEHEGVHENRDGGDRLHQQLREAAAVDEARAVGEEAEVQRAEKTAHEVDAHHVERVVEAPLELQLDGDGAHGAGQETQHDGPEGGQRGAGGGDGDEARDGAGRGAHRRRLAVLDLLHDEPGQKRGGGSGDRVDERDGGGVVGGELGAGVEAEPAEPQQTRAEENERRVVGHLDALLEADALAQDEGEREGGGTCVDVHRRATR